MKRLIFSEDIYDNGKILWCGDREYNVTHECDELYYVTSEDGEVSTGVEKKDEGKLFDIVA